LAFTVTGYLGAPRNRTVKIVDLVPSSPSRMDTSSMLSPGGIVGVKVAVRVGVNGTGVDVNVRVGVAGTGVDVKVAVPVKVDGTLVDVNVAVELRVGVGTAVDVNVGAEICAPTGSTAAGARSARRVAICAAFRAIRATMTPRASTPSKRCFSPVRGRSTTPFTAPSSVRVTRTMSDVEKGSPSMQPAPTPDGVTGTSRGASRAPRGH
jgi:hypothetical protein